MDHDRVSDGETLDSHFHSFLLAESDGNRSMANEIDYCADNRRAGPSEGTGGFTGSEERFLLRFDFSLV